MYLKAKKKIFFWQTKEKITNVINFVSNKKYVYIKRLGTQTCTRKEQGQS